MGTAHRLTVSVTDGNDQESEVEMTNLAPSPHSQHHKSQLDAGALFVLKSKGSWLHCGYHLCTSIVAPALLSLPFAFALLGWVAGIFFLIVGAAVTFYAYNLLSLVLEHYAELGQRQLRFRDMAREIFGPRWDLFFVAPLQYSVCYAAVVACILITGQSLQFIYMLVRPDGALKLYAFVTIAGVLMLALAQIPSFHSLRHINLASLILCLAYSTCAVAGSIYIGKSQKAPEKDYSLNPYDDEDRMFGVYNAISIIATTYGNGIIPEIQATVAPPVKGKMFKGLCLCYAVVISTYFSVAISGYWAFGNLADGTIFSNFMIDAKPLVPKWLVLISNIFTLLQGSAVGLVYLQLTNELLERKLADAKSKQFSLRNMIPRLISRSLSVALATTLAAMFPFFGDMNAVIGAFGCIPLDFVLPMIFYNVTFKPRKCSFIFWVNTFIAVIFSVLAVLGAIAAVRQIVLDAKMYQLFANI